MTMEHEKLVQDLSLLIDRATHPSEASDPLVIHMVCSLVSRSPILVHDVKSLLLEKIKSHNVVVSKKALELLEECMSKCGAEFQREISKNKFLNEMVRLVSKNFSASETPSEIRDKIMDCLQLWTLLHPEKEKIKLAYDKLLKEGVEHRSVVPTVTCPTDKENRLMDEEHEKKFKKLLQSKNREDLQKANLLIQYMVNQSNNKKQLIIKQKDKLRETENAVNLLNEILSRMITDDSIDEQNEDICEELYKICKDFKPEILEDNDELIADAIELSETLRSVIEKYEKFKSGENISENNTHILKTTLKTEIDLFAEITEPTTSLSEPTKPMDDLCDIFTKHLLDSASGTSNQSSYDYSDLLKPIPVENVEIKNECDDADKSKSDSNSKTVQLSAIDEISDSLFKQSLCNAERIKSFNKLTPKKTLKDLAKQNSLKVQETGLSSFTNNEEIMHKNATVVDELLLGDIIMNKVESPIEENKIISSISTEENEDKTPEEIENKIDDPKISSANNEVVESNQPKVELKHLSQINLEINSISPSKEVPRIVADDLQGLRTTFNFASDHPSQDVSVIVICTINQSPLPIANFELDACAPKPCKLRLLPPTGTSLPGVKPFRLPTEDISQILLLYNPTKKPVNITCIISYVVGDDPDPIKESVIAENIPYLE